MKRSLYVLLALLVAISVLFVSCNPEKGIQNEFGSLKAGMSLETTRTIEPSLEALKCTRYVLKGTYSDGKTTFSVETLTGEAYVDKLLAGSWSVYAEGYNADGVLIAKTAAETVEIKTAQTTSKDFNLSYLTEGTGRLSVTIKIAEVSCKVARMDLTIASSNASVSRSANAADGYYEFLYTTELPVGEHELVLNMFDVEGNKVGFTQKKQIHIYTGLTSSETWTNPGVVEAPVFSVEPGRMQSPYQLELSTETDGAAIYYTTDGSVPTAASTFYANPITLSQNTTIKAIAVHPEMYSSSVVSGEFLIPSAVSTFGLEETTANNTRELVLSAVEGSQIRYTLDGTEPTAESALYDSPISVDRNMTVKAIAIEMNKAESEVVSKTYEVVVVAPEFSLEDGTYSEVKNVAITSATAGSQIRYTTDGTEPTASSALYDSPIAVSADTTIKAIAFREGCTPSAVASADYVIDLTGAGSLVIHDPVHYVLSIQSSADLSQVLPQGSELVLTASFAPAVESASYVWYMDNVEIASGNELAFGNNPDGNVLLAGYHEIRVKGTLNGRVYDAQVVVSVSTSHSHIWVEEITVPLTTLRAGENVQVCSLCGETGETGKIYGEYRTYDENGRVIRYDEPILKVLERPWLLDSACYSFEYQSDGTVEMTMPINHIDSGYLTLTVEFNDDGNISNAFSEEEISKVLFDGSPDIKLVGFSFGEEGAYEYLYDENGFVIAVEGIADSDTSVRVDFKSDGRTYWVDGEQAMLEVYEYGSNGRVQRIICYRMDDSLNYIVEYDANGNHVKTTYYNSDGNISDVEEYDSDGNRIKSSCPFYYSDGSMDWSESEYDTNGNHIKSCIYCYNSDGTIIGRSEYEYDSNGNRTKHTSYNSDGTIYCVTEYDENGIGTTKYHNLYYSDGRKEITEYDADGNRTKFTYYNSDGTIYYVDECDENGNWTRKYYNRYYSDGSKEITEYDADGNRTKHTSYNSDGFIDLWEEYEYDANGNPLKETDFFADGRYCVYEIVYDINGNLIVKETNYNSDGTIDQITEYDQDGNEKGSVTYEYDSEGILIHSYAHSPNGEVIVRSDYSYSDGNLTDIREYDANGNLAKETGYNSDGTRNIVYEYDSNGNLVRATTYNSDGSIGITEYATNRNAVKYTLCDSNGTTLFVYECAPDGRLSIGHWHSSSESGTIVYEYDANGNRIKKTYYNSDGTRNIVYEYDSNGNLVRDTASNPDGSIGITEYATNGDAVKYTFCDSNRTELFVYECAPDGRLSISRWYSSDDEFRGVIIYEYDANGNRIKETRSNSDGFLDLWEEYEYDTNGNLTKSIEYVSGVKGITEYDIQGNAIKYTQYDSADSVLFVYECAPNKWISIFRYDNGNVAFIDEYDSSRILTKLTSYNYDGTIDFWSEYEYDANGNRTKATYYNSDGTIDSWSEYEYDTNGNRVKQTSYNSEGRISGVSEYDTNGNRTKYTSYNSDGTINLVHEYDGNGNLIGTYDADGNPID